ncbi:hypothetical protein ES705_39601 [subsurface metagenome]
MLYTVWYKKPGRIFWHKIKDVEGDTIIETAKGQALPVRAIFLVNKIRLEIPMDCIIKFSKERFYDVQANLGREAGQKTQTK